MEIHDGSLQRVIFGWGVFPDACRRVNELGRRPLVLAGRRMARESGVLDRLREALLSAGLEPTFFEGIGPEPTVDVVDEAANEARRRGSDVIVGLGGGSVIDAAKAVAASVRTGASCWDLTIWGRSDSTPAIEIQNPLPVVAVPTVSGTGAEANGTGVVVHAQIAEKAVFIDDRLRPAVAVVDPSLAVSVGPLRTWTGAIDTITHGVEDYLTQEEPDLAEGERRLRLAQRVLEMGARAAENPDDQVARSALAHFAMEVWDGTYSSPDTPWTLHAIAHVVGARLHIGHGLTLTLLLPAWLQAIHQHDPGRLPELSAVAPPAVNLTAGMGNVDLGRLTDEVLKTYGVEGALPGWPHLTHDDVHGILAQARAALRPR